jgi:hypothetical protein
MNRILKNLMVALVVVILSLPVFSCSSSASSFNDEIISKSELPLADISATLPTLSEDKLAKQKEELDKKLMEEATATESDIFVDSTVPVTKNSSADPVIPNAFCDLVIITPAEFVEQLIPLKEHKNKTGVTTKIITLEDIYAAFEGRDEAEKVKYCLADYSIQSKTRFAMLVGDGDRFPVRYTKSDIDRPAIKNWGFFSTDIYYANLFKADGSFDDWDGNKNGYFGELQGEVYTGPINMDNVDLDPEMCVGRIPVSTKEEVSNYVGKVIHYESTASSGDWINNVLLIATTDFVQEAPLFMDELAKNFLKDKQVFKLYGEIPEEIASKLKADNINIEKTAPINTENVVNYINSGVSFICHFGHGTSDSWYEILSIKDFNELDNFDALPIVFTGGCSTADFECHPPYDTYIDINGNWHNGEAAGEVFQDIPPQPACLQPKSNHEGMGEVSTVYNTNGFIGYIGCNTGAQPFSWQLNYLFFKSLIMGKDTLGEMWNYAIKEYYIQTEVPTETYQPDWTAVANFHQPWKFFLFGDPSLRISGL